MSLPKAREGAKPKAGGSNPVSKDAMHRVSTTQPDRFGIRNVR
jgi:hypothetical protein